MRSHALLALGSALTLAGCAASSPLPPATHAAGVAFDRTIVRVAEAVDDEAAAYAVFRNEGVADTRIVGASCACAREVQLHRIVPDKGMVAAWPLALPAGATEAITPPGVPRHMMLVDVVRPIAAGETVTIRFEFADGSHADRAFTAVSDTSEAWQAFEAAHGGR